MRYREGSTKYTIALTLVTLLLSGCQPYVLEEDALQARLDVATPPLDGTHVLAQSFTCQNSYLSEIELLPAVYQTGVPGTISWRLQSAGDQRTLYEHHMDASLVRANVPLLLRFPAQVDSAGRTYQLLLEGTAGVQVGFWRTSFDSFGNGQLSVDGDSPSGDLHFVARCRYDPLTLMRQAGRRWLPHLWLLLPLVMLLLIPGCLAQYALRPALTGDPLTRLGISVASSLAILPVVFLWTSVVGFRWQQALCRAGFALMTLLFLLCLVRSRFEEVRTWLARSHRRPAAALAVVLSITLLLRLIQIRTLVLPAWVDSPQHVLITQLLTVHGAVPSSYEPLLPVDGFSYHFGLHADTAVFAWLSGLAIPEAMLVLGQVLNTLCALGAYVLTTHLTHRRLGGIVAAILVGLVSYFPAYYVSWGRYTQLAGLTILPAALITALDWLEAEGRDRRCLLLASVLLAGLFLTHARVGVFAISFLLASLLLESVFRWRFRTGGSVVQLWGRAVGLAAVGLLLSAPWSARVITSLLASTRASGGLTGDPAYNAVPWGLLYVRGNRELMLLAAMGALVGIWQRRRGIVALLLACLMIALAINPGWAGLPNTNLLNNATAVITLFLPLSVLGGQAFTWCWDSTALVLSRLARAEGTWHLGRVAAHTLLATALAACALRSGWGMVTVVNPETILATQQDLAAMEWIRQFTPANAVFLINTRHWQLGMYTGTDGGYWIPLLTGRKTLLPALPYSYGNPEYVTHISKLAQRVAETLDASEVGFLDLLEQEGVTHIYIGARGGTLRPEMLLRDTHCRPVYECGEVWVFEVVR